MIPVYRDPRRTGPDLSAAQRSQAGWPVVAFRRSPCSDSGDVCEFCATLTFLEILAALAAIICFIGGPLRMLYAALFEEGAPRPFQPYGPPVHLHAPMHAPQQFATTRAAPALPPPPARPQGSLAPGQTPPSWQIRPASLKTRPACWKKKIAPIDSCSGNLCLPVSLAERLREQIRREGPITFHDWMKAALYDPSGGYYQRSDRSVGAGKATIARVRSAASSLPQRSRVILRGFMMSWNDRRSGR